MASPPKAKNFIAETAFIKDLTAIFDERDLTELEIETDAISVRLARGAQTINLPAAPPVQTGVQTMPPPAQAPAGPPVSSEKSSNLAGHPGAVKSPMVGTAYLSPEPDAPQFVQLGEQVKKGQTLFIIEAMKVMNPITAHIDGRVSQILVDNAQPIEFDDVLAVIES